MLEATHKENWILKLSFLPTWSVNFFKEKHLWGEKGSEIGIKYWSFTNCGNWQHAEEQSWTPSIKNKKKKKHAYMHVIKHEASLNSR